MGLTILKRLQGPSAQSGKVLFQQIDLNPSGIRGNRRNAWVSCPSQDSWECGGWFPGHHRRGQNRCSLKCRQQRASPVPDQTPGKTPGRVPRYPTARVDFPHVECHPNPECPSIRRSRHQGSRHFPAVTVRAACAKSSIRTRPLVPVKAMPSFAILLYPLPFTMPAGHVSRLRVPWP